MAIENEDILALKQTISLAGVVRSRGVELRRKGRQLWGLCPFHEEAEPSFAVDERKGLWNCLGKCSEGGDVLSFVMKADGIGFADAYALLNAECGVRSVESKENSPQRTQRAQSKAETRPVGSVPSEPSTKTDAEYLEKAVAYYHKTLVKNEKAIAYLASRGISAEAIQVFRLGYVDGTLRGKLNADGRASLERLGLLNEKGNETMYGSVVFPLVDAAHGKPTGLYARHIEKHQHLYHSGKRRGVFNPSGAKETEEIVLTESVIDALALWSIGIRNMTCSYGVNALTDEILEHLSESRIRRVVLMLDADDAGREASAKFAEKLSSIGIESRTVKLPAKDASEFVAAGGTLEELQRLIEPPRRGDAEESLTTDHRPLTTNGDGSLMITFDNREYRVRGLTGVGLEKLKINLRLNAGNNFHLDTLDLYQARARANFAQAAAKHCRVNESVVNADLLLLIEQLEAERLSMRKTSTNEAESTAAMTEAEKREAIAFLKDEKLCERIVEDFRRCGLVGERSTVLTAYLGSISRKLTEPLALLIVARSGAGKSALQDALCAFVPPEELVRVTRLTGQALFYKDPYSLQRKMLVIAEDEGAMQAVYSLRTLASDQRLSIAATRTDPATGKLSTEHYEVFGPVVIVITTTSAEAFDEETRSRFVQLSMNESIEQTRIILSQQRHGHSLSGVLEKAESEEIKRLHHHAQRLLKPLAVVNPFVEYLTYPSERLIHRREQRKYLSLINSIALLHQYQREIKTAKRGEVEIEYVEVELSDIALANELAEEILGKAMDELAPPVRGMFEAIREACKQKGDELKIKACDVQLTRREIRETTAWSDWQVRMYCQKLVEMEYLWAIQSANGKPSVYQLASDAESEVQSLRGLTGIDELKKRLKETAKVNAASR
ncbi:MAG: CHC2 zinc finger domain-containing protein [Pyrinomonadaceae bacterium]